MNGQPSQETKQLLSSKLSIRAIYRLRVRDADGIVLTTMSTGTAQLGGADLENGAIGVAVATGATQNVPASGSTTLEQLSWTSELTLAQGLRRWPKSI